MDTAEAQHGFSREDGANWSLYTQYRPAYPPSFFEQLFDYHAQKPGACWSAAHDVGAGPGICSGDLARRFDHVTVSDPNGYHDEARKALGANTGLPASRFTFLQEPAERSSVGPASVDAVLAAECIHWTDAGAALQEFHRQLKAGGSLLLSLYNKPLLRGNPDAQRAWDRISLAMFSVKGSVDEKVARAVEMANSGLSSLEFPEDQWENVRRVFINCRGSLGAFYLCHRTPESRIKPGEEVEWRENVAEWTDRQGIDWLKGYISTFAPALPEENARDIWDEIEEALGGGKTLMEMPVAVVLATKKSST